jgi:hypothetical protein
MTAFRALSFLPANGIMSMPVVKDKAFFLDRRSGSGISAKGNFGMRFS